MNWKQPGRVLKQTVDEFRKDDALRLSAALAYYAAFSLAPLLLISIAVAGAFFGEEAVRGQLDDELKRSLGPSGAFAVQDMIAHARKPEQNALVSAAGVVMLLVGAGGFFGQLQAALNSLWGVQPKPGRGFVGMLKDRFASFTMVLGTGFLLLVSMILTAVLESIGAYANSLLSLPPGLWMVVNTGGSFVIVALLFAGIFKVLPDAEVRWRHVGIGAAFTAALFVAGKYLIGWYLGREATASAYGTAGSLALVLLWVYYSTIILLFGAEFTQVWANSRGMDIEPSKDAVKAPNY